MAATRESAPAALVTELPADLPAKLRPGPGRSAAEVAAHQRTRIHAAMVELVGERGYATVKMRDVVRLAGISTRTFYEHFEGKEECFLRTYELIVRRAAARIEAAFNSGSNRQESLRQAVDTLTQAVAEDPRSARFAFIESSAAGAAAVEQMRATESLFEAMFDRGPACDPGGVRLPSMMTKGIVSGIAGAVRGRLLAGREQELPSMANELANWALSFRMETLSGIEDLGNSSASVDAPPQPRVSATSPKNGHPVDDNRPLILSAVAKLAASKSYYQLTAPRIRAAAGVSRRCFDANFEDVEDCFLEALELRVAAALELATSHAEGHTWSSDVYLALEALCSQLAADPVLSAMALSEVFVAGPSAMRRRQEMTETIAERLRASAPPEQRPSRVQAEASIDAIWAVLHHCVVIGKSQQLTRLTSTLTCLILVPLA